MVAGKNDTFVSNRVVPEQTHEVSKESRTLINDCKILANLKHDVTLLDENVGCKDEPVPPDIHLKDKNLLHQYAVEKVSNIQSAKDIIWTQTSSSFG
jgi:hypothetical protein